MRLLLYNQKYGPTLQKMDIRHGKDFDCMNQDCPVCIPYRQREYEEYSKLNEEDKKKVHFGRIG